MNRYTELIDSLLALRDERQRQVLQRFFKTAPGQYGAGDQFLGIKVPVTRLVARQAGDFTLDEVQPLLASEWHEVRLCGFLILVGQMKQCLPSRRLPLGDAAGRDALAVFYLRHARRADNWDLVDLSCPGIVGEWLRFPSADGVLPDASVLDHLAVSDCLWEQRIAIVSTLTLIRHDLPADTLRIATLLLDHPHDLIHKAVGWMLREVGKRDPETLRAYLGEHVGRMDRTTLRYAIERIAEPERQEWLRR